MQEMQGAMENFFHSTQKWFDCTHAPAVHAGSSFILGKRKRLEGDIPRVDDKGQLC